MKNRLLLGTASPRRRLILSELGIDFDVDVPDVEELTYHGEPERTVLESARLKNQWCSARHPERTVLTADTIVVFEGECVLKPSTMDEARSFLRRFSGKSQLVFTGLVLSEAGEITRETAVQSEVVFRELSDHIIEEYFARVDPLDKAGAYDIDQHGDIIIESFSGSYSNIMGLPREVVADWLPPMK